MRIGALAIICLMIFANLGRAQISLTNLGEIEKIKSRKTYILLKEAKSGQSNGCKEIFKKYWTFSSIEFIDHSEVEKYMSANNSFFSIGGYQI